MSAAELYERINGACASEHGLSSDDEREAHVRAIVTFVLSLRGVLR